MEQDYLDVIGLIQEAKQKYNSANKERYAALQDLYKIFMRSFTDTNVQQQIDSHYSLQPKAPKTKHYSNKIAYLAFSISKQRVSDVHKLLTLAQEKDVEANDFAGWLVKQGGTSAVLAKTRKGSAKAKEKKKPTYYSVLNELWQNVSHGSSSPTNPTNHSLSQGEMVVQVVRRSQTGYLSTWIKLSEADAQFVELTEAASSPSEDVDLVSQVSLVDVSDAA